jgi:hypothetical protein
MIPRHSRLVAILAGLTVLAIVSAPLAWNRLETWGVGLHQRSVTQELANWEQECGRVTSEAEVDRAVGMLEYISGYYVPADGYRSNPQTEAALEAQRAKTLSTIAGALREYTGKDLGPDAKAWRDWLATQSKP